MSTGQIGNLYKLHAPIPYIYNTVTGLSVVDCKYSYQQIVHIMLRKRTFADQVSSDNCLFTFCFKTISMTHSLTEEYHGCSNLHARDAEISHNSDQLLRSSDTVLPTSLFSSLAFTLGKLQGPLVMQLTSTLKLLLGWWVRGEGAIYAFQIQHKL